MPTQDQLHKAARLWSQYHAAADKYEIQARQLPALGAESMRKSLTFRANAEKVYLWMNQNHLVKGFPIPKKFKWQGMDVSIESPAGSVRNWYDPFEKRAGVTLMLCDYGYLRGTTGADGDQVDVYFGPHASSAAEVYVIRQLKGPDFRYYDEDKCMIGYDSEQDAVDAYHAHYDDKRFLGAVESFPVDVFVAAVKRTRKAPTPVGGWANLNVQRRASDMKDAVPQRLLDVLGDRTLVVAPKAQYELPDWRMMPESPL